MSVNLKTYLFMVHLSCVCLGSAMPGYEYHDEVQGYLKLHRVRADRLDAGFICRDEGAVLVAPWSPQFTAAVNKLQKPSDDEETVEAVLSGAVEIFPDGVFSRYSKRLPGVLMNTQRCVAFFADGSTGDVDCEDKLPYVCFIPITSTSAPATTSTTKVTTSTTEVTTGTTEVTTSTTEDTTSTTEDTTSTTEDTTSTTEETTSTTEDTSSTTEDTTSTTEDTTSTTEDATSTTEDTTSTTEDTTSTTEDQRPDCEISGYEYSSFTGHCYKFHKQANNWTIAKKICNSEDGHLAVINSQEEASFLRDLYQGVLDSDIINAKYSHFAAIGIRKPSFGDWQTIDGQPLELAGYSNWRPDEPKDEANDLVGYMYRDGTLISFFDAWKTPFICEMDSYINK